MSYRDLNIKINYETGVDDLVNEFYIPALSIAKRYDRIAGFFSSTSLALASRGLAGLIKNNGTMRLITCPRLSSEDVEIIQKSYNKDEYIEQKLLESIQDIESDFQKDHVAALGWMLSKKILEIKIAFIYENNILLNVEQLNNNPIMHEKVGIMIDNDFNGISFSGSNNETFSGWVSNCEEFKVFCSWIQGQKEYYDGDKAKFEKIWKGEHPYVKIKDIPDAVKKNLIEKSNDFDLDTFYSKYYTVQIKQEKKEELKLFSYQDDAVKKWKNNNHRMLLEMATGCGKTRTAIGCIKEFLKEDGPKLIIISCPGNTLSIQWKNDIDHLNIDVDEYIICDGTNSDWRKSLKAFLAKLATNYYQNLFIYTTHDTCSCPDFIKILKEKITPKIRTFFIGDEVHGLGSSERKNGLLDFYEYRLGLSATPSRWFDEYGTKLIESFFGNQSFKFTLHDALININPKTNRPFLVNYRYNPYFVNLTDEELQKYKKLSDKIQRMASSTDSDMQEITEFLLFQRANIEKSAENKYSVLENILNEIGPGIDNTIIFVSPEQKLRVLEMLAERKIEAHSFTEKEASTPSKKYGGKSERDYLIDLFKGGKYKVLVAIKCLDEGIDIPSAKRAIVMASCTNPREYVQRIGRVIRQCEGKKNAEIFDLIIQPDTSLFADNMFKSMEKKIFEKELIRVFDLSENAINNVTIINKLYQIKGALK